MSHADGVDKNINKVMLQLLAHAKSKTPSPRVTTSASSRLIATELKCRQSVLSSCSCPAYLYDSRPVRFYCQMKQMPALSNRLETIQCSSSVRRPTRAREEVR